MTIIERGMKRLEESFIKVFQTKVIVNEEGILQGVKPHFEQIKNFFGKELNVNIYNENHALELKMSFAWYLGTKDSSRRISLNKIESLNNMNLEHLKKLLDKVSEELIGYEFFVPDVKSMQEFNF